MVDVHCGPHVIMLLCRFCDESEKRKQKWMNTMYQPHDYNVHLNMLASSKIIRSAVRLVLCEFNKTTFSSDNKWIAAGTITKRLSNKGGVGFATAPDKMYTPVNMAFRGSQKGQCKTQWYTMAVCALLSKVDIACNEHRANQTALRIAEDKFSWSSHNTLQTISQWRRKVTQVRPASSRPSASPPSPTLSR